MESKTCTQCLKNQPVSNYYKDNTIITKVGYLSKCKICCKINTKERIDHEKDLTITQKTCSVCKIEQDIKKFYKSTRHTDGYFSFCSKCHTDKVNNRGNNPRIKRTVEYMKEYNKIRYSTAENKIKYSIRKSILTYVKDKKNRSIEYMGCDINFFRLWIESNFDKNMNWENHGTYWHFDHIKPCASFDLTEDSEIYLCYNWSNYRPCNKTENIIKSDKLDKKLIDQYLVKKQQFLENNKKSIKLNDNMYTLCVLLPEVKTLTCI